MTAHKDSTRGDSSNVSYQNAKSNLRASDYSRKVEGGTDAISSRTNANLSKVQMNTRAGIEDLMKAPAGAIGTSGHRYPSAPRDFLGA